MGAAAPDDGPATLNGSGGGGGGSLGALVNEISSSSSSSSSSEDPNLSTLLISCDIYVANYITHPHESAKPWSPFIPSRVRSAPQAKEGRKTRGINLVFWKK